MVDVECLFGKFCMFMLYGMYSFGCLVGVLSVVVLVGLMLFWYFFIFIVFGLLSLLFFVCVLFLLDLSKVGVCKGGGFILLLWVLFGLGLLIFCVFVFEGGVVDWSVLFLYSVLDVFEWVVVLGFVVFFVVMVVGWLFGDCLCGCIDDVLLLCGLGLLVMLGMLVVLFSFWLVLSIVGFGVVGLGLLVMVLIVISVVGN